MLVGLSKDMVLAAAWLPCLSSWAQASVDAEKRLGPITPAHTNR